MVYSLWFIVYDSWFMVYASWFEVFFVFCLWFMVNGVPDMQSPSSASIVRTPVNEQLLSRNVERLRGGLVLKAHRLLFHSTLGSSVIKKQTKSLDRQDTCRLRVQGSGFRVQGSGFRVQGSGSRVQG